MHNKCQHIWVFIKVSPIIKQKSPFLWQRHLCSDVHIFATHGNLSVYQIVIQKMANFIFFNIKFFVQTKKTLCWQHQSGRQILIMGSKNKQHDNFVTFFHLDWDTNMIEMSNINLNKSCFVGKISNVHHWQQRLFYLTLILVMESNLFFCIVIIQYAMTLNIYNLLIIKGGMFMHWLFINDEPANILFWMVSWN